MFCPSCGAEVHLKDDLGVVDVLYCENCKEKSSVRSQGKATKEEMQMQRRSYMARYLKAEEIETSRDVPKGKLAKVYR